MKFAAIAFASALTFLAAVPAVAENSAPAAPATAAKALSTRDTTIGDLLANPAAKAVLDKHIPGLSDNAQIGMASGMTLRDIQPMAADKITEAQLEAIDTDLAKIPAK